ncbi:MAG: prepilin-type N-terminal cleavage/methylation domain-containing protein [Deltaproteobacteria bacterium]|nr:prepilin-type N-terminal cleavage/methylation domain-containing protein [Deltaproteobacteria bacterium]
MQNKILKSNRGFSLIEIMVTMGIVAMILGLAATLLTDNGEQKLSDISSQIATSIKMIFNESAVKGQYFRLKIDLTENTMTPEYSAEPFRISSEEEADKAASDKEGRAKEEKKTSPSEGAESSLEEAKPKENFSPVDLALLKEIKLPQGLKFKNIFVEHAPVPVDSGQVFVYFFPNGWVEKMVMNLCDESEENFYSLETYSASGKTRIRASYAEMKLEGE